MQSETRCSVNTLIGRQVIQVAAQTIQMKTDLCATVFSMAFVLHMVLTAVTLSVMAETFSPTEATPLQSNTVISEMNIQDAGEKRLVSNLQDMPCCNHGWPYK